MLCRICDNKLIDTTHPTAVINSGLLFTSSGVDDHKDWREIEVLIMRCRIIVSMIPHYGVSILYAKVELSAAMFIIMMGAGCWFWNAFMFQRPCRRGYTVPTLYSMASKNEATAFHYRVPHLQDA